MMPYWIVAIITTLLALLLNLGMTPLILKLSHHRKWYDLPGDRKVHQSLIPRLGGIGMFVSFVLAALAVSILLRALTAGAETGMLQPRFLALFAGLLVVHWVGLIDDFRSLPAPLKLSIQVVAGAIVTTGGFTIDSFTLPYMGRIDLGLLAYPATVLWLVGIANALNLIDGMDGLAGGIAAFAALTMGLVALIQEKLEPALLAFAMLGAIVGFLRYNFPPARIFMGDSGSYFLGFFLASLPLLRLPKTAAIGTLIIPLTLLIVPILDTLAAIVRRVRQGRHPFSPDKEHLHHKLLNLGFSERRILAVIYGFSLYLTVVVVTSVILPEEANVYLVMMVWIGTVMGYYALDALKHRRRSVRRDRTPEAEESEEEPKAAGNKVGEPAREDDESGDSTFFA